MDNPDGMTQQVTEAAPPPKVMIGDQASNFVESGLVAPDELRSMPIGMRIMFDGAALSRFYGMAKDMAKSGLVGKHLEDKPEACFAVVRMALNWNMDPFSVAQSTYSPGKGKIGIEGKLAAAAMVGSKKVKYIEYEHGGDWEKVVGNFETVQAQWPDGNPKVDKQTGQPVMVAKAKYTPEDEAGLYVIATAKMFDDTRIPTPKIYLRACHPRNSTLWASNPYRQIMYVADRMLSQLAAGDVMMGVHFDAGLLLEFNDEDPTSQVVDVTPPKAVDPIEEGISGGGETTPGTESGLVEHDDDGVIIEPAPTERAPTEKVDLQFQGVKYKKTAFVRDVKQSIAACEDIGELDTLAIEIADAKDSAVGEAPRMWQDINDALSQARQKLEAELEGDAQGTEEEFDLD